MTPAHESRLRKVEDTLLEQRAAWSSLGESVSAIRTEVAEAKKSLSEMIAPIGEAVIGTNKNPGLLERVRSLESARTNAKWVIGILVSAVVPLLAKFVIEFLRHVPVVG